MRYVVFDKLAAERLILRRDVFSVEFETPQKLMRLIRGDTHVRLNIDDVYVHNDADGLFFIGKKEHASDENHAIFVIDCEQSNIFGRDENVDEDMIIIQKILRFSIRYWNNHAFPQSEIILNDSNKAVLFPFPYTSSSGFKLVIERCLEIGKDKGINFSRPLLLYKANSDPAPATAEKPCLNNFDKAVTHFSDAYNCMLDQLRAEAARDITQSNAILYDRSLQEHRLKSNMCMHYTQWSKKLSTVQKDILNIPVGNTVRIQGAAGTGKTLVLILRLIKDYKEAVSANNRFKSIFFTHSSATEEAIKYYIQSIGGFAVESTHNESQSVFVTTLYGYFIDLLKGDVSKNDVLENDAQDAKTLQQIYIIQCLDELLPGILTVGREEFSPEFRCFIESDDKYSIANMLMHEFFVQIRGNAFSSKKEYLDLPSLSTGVPVKSIQDKLAVYRLFREYQRKLDETRQFDSDDIAISAYQKLNTPIWRRRRLVEGFDCIYLDETHLFNINELQSIHHLTKNEGAFPVFFAIDTAQAIGELACTTEELTGVFCSNVNIDDKKMRTVFRNSQAIINLATSILSMGTQIFSKLESMYPEFVDTLAGERPVYKLLDDDDAIIENMLADISDIRKKNKILDCDICIIPFSTQMQDKTKEFLLKKGVDFTLISRRGDLIELNNATKRNSILVALPEYVGGLAFQAVLLLGVDDGRVPQEVSDISSRFFEYMAINKLYVSITRAVRFVNIYGSRQHGYSRLFKKAIETKIVDVLSSE